MQTHVYRYLLSNFIFPLYSGFIHRWNLIIRQKQGDFIYMKKIIFGTAVALLCSAVVFAEMDFAGGKLTFENTMTLKPGVITTNQRDEELDGIHFGGIYNTTEITLNTEFLDLYIEPELKLYNSCGRNIDYTSYYTHAGEIYNYGYFSVILNDFNSTIKPFEKVWFGIADEMYTKGSYLPVSDSNVSYGALGTSFTALFMPVKGLKITAGLPGGNYIYNFGYDGRRNDDGKYSDDTRPVVKLGVEYTFDESLCFAFIMNDLFFNQFVSKTGIEYKPYYGFYASFNAKKWLDQNLTINAGYAYYADGKYGLDNYNVGLLLSASVEWKNDSLTLAAQGMFRLSQSEYAKDYNYEIESPFNLDFKAGYNFNENWLAECYFYMDKYEEHYSAGEMWFSISPKVTYTCNEHHKFRAGMNYNFYVDRWNSAKDKYEDGVKNFSVNLNWIYTL